MDACDLNCRFAYPGPAVHRLIQWRLKKDPLPCCADTQMLVLLLIMAVFVFVVASACRASESVSFIARRNKSRGERECGRALGLLFPGQVFVNGLRPKWLTNSDTRRRLELDWFCESLQLAVEYQGRQHRHFTPYFHKDELGFRAQQQRDELKRALLRNIGVQLIEVWYDVHPDHIYRYLANHETVVRLRRVSRKVDS